MKLKYGCWCDEYNKPRYWDVRTPLFIGKPKFFHLYQDFNDKKVRVFLKKLTGSILDAGCGDGRFIAYADVGIDFSKGMLKRTKSHHKDRSIIQASILYLPFKDKAFSTVFTVDVLFHIPRDKWSYALKEMSRIANDCYNFMGEDRSVMGSIFAYVRNIPFKKVFWKIFPYVAVFLAFPFDRVKKLTINTPSELITVCETD